MHSLLILQRSYHSPYIIFICVLVRVVRDIVHDELLSDAKVLIARIQFGHMAD